MKVLFLSLVLLASLYFATAHQPVVTEEFVSKLNQMPGRSQWLAGTNPKSWVSSLSFEQAKGLCGTKLDGPTLPRKKFGLHDTKVQSLPDSFDSRTNWANCWTIQQVRDQSACGSCWAFGASEAMSDRYCTYGVNNNLTISDNQLVACCSSCGMGCNGGYPASAWSYWKNNGLVDEACSPYPFPSCDHHIPNSPNPCPSNEYPTPACHTQCADGANWQNSLHHASSVYSVSGEQDIMQEIYQHGPVETAFTVYEDFLTYTSGIYSHKSGSEVGGHAVKFVGWGVQNGEKYWIVANSWNTHWGINGFFWIKKGNNECGIESSCNAGVPKN